MKNIYTHLVYVGGSICVSPLLVHAYAKGKLTEAYAHGSAMSIDLGGLTFLDYGISIFGALVVCFVGYNVWRARDSHQMVSQVLEAD